MPIDKSRYPDNWDEISLAVKEEAGWVCERCGTPHMSDGTMGSCLTTHHPDRDPENPHALIQALCARCHLKDEPRARRAERNKDQLRLF